MATYNDYISYFKGLADKYLANAVDYKTFYRAGLDEFLNGMTTVGNYPVMLLDKYDFVYSDNGFDNVRKKRTVAFIIYDHIDDINDYDAIDAAYDNSEIIVDKIYNQIREDKKNPVCAAFLQTADLTNVQVTPVPNQSNGDYGYFITINVSSVHDTRIL